jgi:hypothetical protein
MTTVDYTIFRTVYSDYGVLMILKYVIKI